MFELQSDRVMNALMDRIDKDKAREDRRVEFIHKTYFQEVCDLIESNNLDMVKILTGNNLTNTCD